MSLSSKDQHWLSILLPPKWINLERGLRFPSRFKPIKDRAMVIISSNQTLVVEFWG